MESFRVRKLVFALIVLVLSLAGAAFSFARMSRLRSDGNWLLATANTHASDYAGSLEASFADAELSAFEQRRSVLEQAHRWQRLEVACVLVGVAAALSAYALYVLRRASTDELRDGMSHR